MDILLLVSLILASLFFALASGRRMEETLAPFLCMLMLVLYVLSIFQALPLMHWIAPAAAAVLAVCALLRLKHGESLLHAACRIITPGMLCFGAAAAFLLLCSRGHIVHSTDDIYYWGIEVRSLFANNGLVPAYRHLSPRFMTYTPGMQLWQWTGMRVLGEWNEACLYAMLWLLYLAFLVPLTRSLTWRKAWLVPLATVCMICAPTLMNADAYDMLRVDTGLALVTGYALMQALSLWRDEKAGVWELVCFSLSLCAMVLIKQIGIAWAVMVMAFAWLTWRPGRWLKRWRMAAACAMPVLVFISWKIVCYAFDLSGMHLSSASHQIGQMLSGSWQVPAWLIQLPGGLWSAMTVTDGHALPMLAWLVVLIVMLWLLSRGEPRKRAVRIWCISACVMFLLGYAVILVLSILDGSEAALPDRAFLSALTSRYGQPLPMGLFLLTAAWVLPAGVKAASGRRISAVLLAVLTLCFARWNSMYTNFAPEAYAQSYGEVAYESVMLENFWIDDLEGEDPAVVLYVTQYPPFIPERLQYPAAPHKIVIAPLHDMDAQVFAQLLENNRITHVICMDDLTSAYENAAVFTEDGWMDVSTLYTVSWENGEPLLAYY